MNEEIWKLDFDTPMPEGITYWEFDKLRAKKWLADDIRNQFKIVESIKKLKQTDGIVEFLKDEQRRLDELYREKIKLEIGW